MKEARLILPAPIAEGLRAHLFSDLRIEKEAFLIAGVSAGDCTDLLARHLITVGTEDLELESAMGLSLKDSKKVEVMREARNLKGAIVEAHTHPFAHGGVGFSNFDMEQLAEFVPYARIRNPGRFYGATVWGVDCVSGLVWSPSGGKPMRLRAVITRGPRLNLLEGDGRGRAHPKRAPGDRPGSLRYDRQLQVMGQGGQHLLSSLKVGIVGAGGTGSHVVQQLAHIGVGEIVLVDDDVVDETNLNRLVGAVASDVGKSKVKVLARRAKKLRPDLKFVALRAALRSRKGLASLKDMDAIVGCVDNDGARLILAELSSSYLVPYLDCASSIDAAPGGGLTAGGRVIAALPGTTGCLWCLGEIDRDEAAFDLATEEEQRERIRRGYSSVRAVESSVVSINGVIASIAVEQLVAMATGFGDVRSSRYDALRSRVAPINWTASPTCPICVGNLGLGDTANVDRYALPSRG